MIDNHATVGRSYLSIYGYGPVNSEVSLRGFGVSEKTISDKTGLFRFNSVYNFTYSYPELCIQAVDDKKRVTQPTCIPALPKDILTSFEIGPILLSPTISLNNNKIVTNSESYLSGKTTPNTKVNIYLAKNKQSLLLRSREKKILSLVSTANAYSLPVLNTTSNEKGEFDINMPTSDIAEYKVFASTKFAENLSAKSNTLEFAVISSVKSFLEWLWNFLLQNKIMIFIIAEVIILVILFIKALKQTTKKYKRHTERDYLEELKII
ncbi:MAG: hypothetical protein ACD_19C00426G0013 [uncultured bacterium]|nr:MAG: hypothetical protein ACD_19C00426G0013 [uncultured bacterium]